MAITAQTSWIALVLVLALGLQSFVEVGAATTTQTRRRRARTYHKKFCGYASVCHDPIFVGLNNQRFEFHGKPGNAYSLISTPDMQVNAAMIDLPVPKDLAHATFIGAVGVVLADARVHIQAIEGHKLEVSVNGAVLELTNMEKEVEAMVNQAGIAVRLYSREGDVPDTVQIITPGLDLAVIARGSHLDVVVEKLSRAVCAMHGALGQTYTQGLTFDLDTLLFADDPSAAGFVIAGAVEDYKVSSLFAADAKFDLYGLPAAPCTAAVAAGAAEKKAELPRKMVVEA